MTGDFDDLVPVAADPGVSDDFADLVPATAAKPATGKKPGLTAIQKMAAMFSGIPVYRGASADIPRTAGEALDDTALSVRQGTRDVVGGAVGLPANLVNLIANPIPMRLLSAGAEKLGLRRPESPLELITGKENLPQPAAVRGIRESLNRSNAADAEAWQSDKAAAQEQEMAGADGFVENLAYMIQNPSAAGMMGARQIPQLIQAIPGSVVGTIAAQAAGAGAQNEAQTVEQMRAAGATEEEIANAGSNVFAASTGLNAALPAALGPSAQAVERALAGRIGREAGGDLVESIARSFAGESLEGVASEGGDQAISNFASGRPVGEGVGTAAAQGLVFDGPAGAIAGGLENLSAPRGTLGSVDPGAAGPQATPPPELVAAITSQLQAANGQPAPTPGAAPAPSVAPGAPLDLAAAIGAGQVPAPRTPELQPPPAESSRDDLVEAWRQAETDDQRAQAAAYIAAFDQGIRAPASAPAAAVDAAAQRIDSAPDPDAAFRRPEPVAPEPTVRPQERQAPEPATTVPTQEPMGAPASAPAAPRGSDALALRREIGWEERGGRMIRGGDLEEDVGGPRASGDVIGRTPWVAPRAPDGTESQFWRTRPDKGLTETQARTALDKYEAGQPLRPIEQRFVDHAERVAQGYRDTERELQADMEAYDQADRAAALRSMREGHGIEIDASEEAEALALVELAQRAYDAGLDEIDIEQASNENDRDYATRLWQAIKESDSGREEAQGDRDRSNRIEEGREAGSAQGGLFGQPSSREQAEGLRRERDDERDGKTGRETPAFSSTDLGAGARPEQGRVEASSDMFVTTRGQRQAQPEPEPDHPTLTYGDTPARADATPKLIRQGKNQVDKLIKDFGGSILADSLARDFQATTTAQLIGKVAKTADDFAAIAQVYRNPLYETLHYVFVDNDGLVLGETAVSDRMPSSSAAFPRDVQRDPKATMRWLISNMPTGTTGLWLSHNHPSGNPSPSAADLRLTANIDNMLKQFTDIRLQGHVILNHERYAWLSPDGTDNGILNLVPESERTPDPLRDSRGDHWLTSETIDSPTKAGEIGRYISSMTGKNSVGVVITSVRGDITMATSFPIDQVSGKRGPAMLSKLADRTGAGRIFLVLDHGYVGESQPRDARSYNFEQLRKLAERGLIFDIIVQRENGSWSFASKGLTSGRSLGPHSAVRRKRDGSGAKVFEADDQTETPAFRKWFGDSKVIDENGDPLVVYHGSTTERDEFKKGFGDDRGENLFPNAFFFTPDREMAETYGDEVTAAFLRIENPYVARTSKEFERLEIDDAESELRADGHDGAILYLHPDGDPEYVAFDSAQIKSATGNNGEFDPENPNIVRSPKSPYQAYKQQTQTFGRLASLGYTQGAVTQPVPGGRFESLQRTADALRTKLQDKMLPLLRTQERTGAPNAKAVTSVTLDDAMNAYRLENLMHGRAKDQVDRANDDIILPAQRMMRNLNVTPEMVQDVMLATHAPERNAKVDSMHKGERQGNLDGSTQASDDAAGITTPQAKAILAGTEAGPYSGKILTKEQIRDARLVWDKFRMLREQTIDNMVDAGQISKKQATTLRAAYDHYVPLRGKDSPFAGEGAVGTGRGITVRKSPIKRAMGRGKGNLAKNILGEIVGDFQRSVATKEKARVARGFLKFALENPMPDVFRVEPVDLEWKYNELTGEAYLGVKNSAEDADKTIVVRHDGEPVRIRFIDPELRDAMMNMGVDDLSSFVKIVGSVNRWRSKVLTQWNPAFTPINVLRDLQFGLTALTAERGVKGAARAALDYLPAMQAMWRQAGPNAPGDLNKPISQYTTDDFALEASRAGMKTGLTQVDDVQDLQRRMSEASTRLMRLAADGQIRALASERIRRTLGPIVEVVERVNDATENALRLAAYIGDRKSGKSVEQSAEYAKNLTINFNRKGQLGPALNALYLFYNASVQGTHAVQRVMRNPRVLGYLAGMAGLQAMLAAQMMGEDDDNDGVTAWDSIPDYVKRTSLVIPLGALTGKPEDYFAIPMPYGFNIFPYAGGRLAQRYKMGARETDANVVTDIIKAQFEAFSPIPIADGYSSLFGDTLGFMFRMYKNEDDFGIQIFQDDQYEDYKGPRALKGKADTPRVYQVTAQLLAKLGGANLDKRIPPVGYLDIAPEQIEAVVNYLGGGLSALGNKSIRWYEQMDAGNLESVMDVVAATPIAQRLAGTGRLDRAIANRYYAERGELSRKRDVLQDELRKIKPDDKPVKDEFGRPTTAEGRKIKEMAKEDFAYSDLAPEIVKKKGRGDQKRGMARRTSTDGVELAPGDSSVYTTLKSTEKGNKAANAAIRQLRSRELTNDEAVRIVQSFSPTEDKSSKAARYSLEDLGLPEKYTGDVVAPERVRNRAIKLVQDARMVNQRTLLRILGMSRANFDAGKKLEEDRDAED